MAREVFSTPSTSPGLLKLEVARFAANNNLALGEEAHQIALLDGLFLAYRAKLFAYYHAAATPEERLARLGEISQMFRETRFTDGARVFTTAAGNAAKEAAVAYAEGGDDCPPGQHCSERQCVPDVG